MEDSAYSVLITMSALGTTWNEITKYLKASYKYVMPVMIFLLASGWDKTRKSAPITEMAGRLRKAPSINDVRSIFGLFDPPSHPGQ